MKNLKNEKNPDNELLDLITEFKPEDSFIEEALGTDLDNGVDRGSPVKVYAGKRSPMKIVAPIAACLAVAAAAGILVVNVNRGKLGMGPAASIEESSEPGEVDETSEPEETKTFLEKCKEIVSEEYELASQDNEISSTNYFDIDFDGEDELLIFPKLINGFGVRVFKGDDPDNIQDLGAFGTDANFVPKFFDYASEADQKYYYYNFDKASESCTTDIHEVSFDEDTDKVKDVVYLKYVVTRSNDVLSTKPFLEKAYSNGEEISIERLFFEASMRPFASIVNFSDWDGMSEIDKALAEKYDMPLTDIRSLAHSFSQADVNDDGRDEVFIRFENSEELRDFYVFGTTADGEMEFMGELTHEGMVGYGESAPLRDRYVHKFDDGAESYCYFLTVNREEDGCWEGAVNKIIVNEDGSFGFEKILTNGREKLDDGTTRDYCRINGKDVTGEEFSEVFDKYARK